MKIGMTINEYGTEESKHICDTCGDEFTVCPPEKEGSHAYDNCLAKNCPSYDPGRDADKFFDKDSDEIVFKTPINEEARNERKNNRSKRAYGKSLS